MLPAVNTEEKQIAQRGNWFGPWQPVSGCQWQGLGSGGNINIDYEFSPTASWDSGADISFVIGWFNARMGYQVSETFSRKEGHQCDVPAGSVGQIWWEQKYVWADMQKRTRVTMIGGCQGSHVGAWSKYYRVDLPIKKSDGNMITGNIGCSTGRENVNC